MDLFVNGEKIDATLENEKTIGDVLTSFELTCEQNSAAVIGIKIDSQKVEAESFDEFAVKPILDSTKIEFEIVTKQSINDSFANLSNLFKYLSLRMEQVPIELQNGNGKEVSSAITALADDIDLFCHVAYLSSLFPETYKVLIIDEKPFDVFFADLTSILSEFESALKSNDTILVGDLAEYEICPRLKAVATALEKFNEV